jgi:hypothetical protein
MTRHASLSLRKTFARVSGCVWPEASDPEIVSSASPIRTAVAGVVRKARRAHFILGRSQKTVKQTEQQRPEDRDQDKPPPRCQRSPGRLKTQG